MTQILSCVKYFRRESIFEVREPPASADAGKNENRAVPDVHGYILCVSRRPQQNFWMTLPSGRGRE